MKIKLLNKIAKIGLAEFPADYTVGTDVEEADAILVRSASMLDMEFEPELDAIARAGAGVNNIPLDRCADQGIVVFNTPGANAGGVKELTICGLFLASRDILAGSLFAESLTGDIGPQVEKGKSAFAGCEISGKTLGVIGLGAIGALVANAALNLGMNVVGCDPFLTDAGRARLDPRVAIVPSFSDVFASADYLTLHVPATPDTKGMICEETLAQMKDGVRILNFARGDLVQVPALLVAMEAGKVARYVTDFPTAETLGHPGVINIPHLGASTAESEDNCAVMAARQTRDYLENGTVKNSVNFPAADAPRKGVRLVLLGTETPGLEQAAAAALPGAALSHFSRKGRVVLFADYDGAVPEHAAEAAAALAGIVRVRELS